VEESLRLLTDREAYDAMARVTNPYGDDQAAARIVDRIRQDFRLS
jgi:UDP-N-acetylglucosamine 2-epimerase